MISKQFGKYSMRALPLAVMSWFCLPLRASTGQTLTTNVGSLNGTENGGDEFPGAVIPFGMVQWSPDTQNEEDGGYLYSDNQYSNVIQSAGKLTPRLVCFVEEGAKSGFFDTDYF